MNSTQLASDTAALRSADSATQDSDSFYDLCYQLPIEIGFCEAAGPSAGPKNFPLGSAA